MSNKVKCPICKYWFKQITNTHIKKHNMTVEEFKYNFPNNPLVSETIKEKNKTNGELGKLSSILSNNTNKENKKYYYNLNPYKCINCNNPLCYEKRNNKFCNKSCAATFNNKNRHYSNQTREKLSLKSKNNFSHKNFINRRTKKTAIILNKTCPECNRKFKIKKSKNRKYCSSDCLSKNVGGYRPNSVKSNGKFVNDSYGNITYLQSSYEVTCSELLDDFNIKWFRPNYLNYYSNDKIRKYYPDFYLPDIDIYLDPKNDFLIKKDSDKIQKAIDYNNVIVLILSKDILYNPKLFYETINQYTKDETN